jgi:hypothetical protein
MGSLFSGRRRALAQVQINLEAPQANSPEEASVCGQFTSQIMESSAALLGQFSAYHDAQALAAAAISSPSEETKQAAWEAVVPNVDLQMELFTLSQRFGTEFLKVVQFIIDRISPSTDIEIFQLMPLLTRAIADGINLILTLDEIKLGIPRLLNDLAYFRRNATAYNTDGSLDATLEKSNETTIFWASPTPFLSAFIQLLTTRFPPSSHNFQSILLFLGSVVDVGASLLLFQKSHNDHMNKLCLRCIVGGTLMYDRLSPSGAFAKPFRFHVLKAMEVLVKYDPRQTALINGVKFGSKHLNDEKTDPKIKALFR